MVADQLAEGGFRHLRAPGRKPRHVDRLVQRWHAEGIAAATFKNRMAALRWLAEKIGKQNIVARDNASYGIADLRHVSNDSKATVLDADKLASVADPYTALSLRLQAALGLQHEERVNLRHQWADRGDSLHLNASWTKGGRERDVPTTNDEQRQVLTGFKAHAGAGSLIPAEMSYRDQLNRFKAQTAEAGIDHGHGLRHACAQAIRNTRCAGIGRNGNGRLANRPNCFG
jgi:integrase